MLGQMTNKESWEASARYVARTSQVDCKTASSFQRAIFRRRGLAQYPSLLKRHWGFCSQQYRALVVEGKVL